MKNLVIVLLVLLPGSIFAQFISIKSLPLSTGDQFIIFPSQNMSIGGVNIGLNDSLSDPINNPANGYRLNDISVFAQPTFYNISGNLGGAWTLPATLYLGNQNYFGVASFALQQLEGANINDNNFWFGRRTTKPVERNVYNKYLFFSLGKELSNRNWSVGGSFYWADLNSIGGVDLLYRNSIEILQDGSLLEFRGGLMYNNDLTKFEALVLFNRFKVEHNVKYLDIFWDALRAFAENNFRTEKNIDHTNTWGVHLAYKEKVVNSNLTIGAIATINLKTHPKIPNYEIMNIPRDPGDSWAFNFGAGIGTENEKIRFGLDLTYEPIWANTWAEAEEVIDIGNGEKILPGQKTVENDFTFSNIIGRIGVNNKFDAIDVGIGLEIYNRSYDLDQFDYVSKNDRSQEEDWTEVTFTWGIGFRFKHFNIMYNGHVVSGAGIPGVAVGPLGAFAGRELASDFIVAPSGSLEVEDEKTIMHQFVIQVPISGK